MLKSLELYVPWSHFWYCRKVLGEKGAEALFHDIGIYNVKVMDF